MNKWWDVGVAIFGAGIATSAFMLFGRPTPPEPVAQPDAVVTVTSPRPATNSTTDKEMVILRQRVEAPVIACPRFSIDELAYWRTVRESGTVATTTHEATR